MEFFDLSSAYAESRNDRFGVRLNYRGWTIIISHGFDHDLGWVSSYKPGEVKPADYIYEVDEIVPDPWIEREVSPEKFGEEVFNQMNLINMEIEGEDLFQWK